MAFIRLQAMDMCSISSPTTEPMICAASRLNPCLIENSAVR